MHRYIQTILVYAIVKYMCPLADVDECATGRDDCSVNADCTNTIGSFQCTCRQGFEGDGRVCRGEHCTT